MKSSLWKPKPGQKSKGTVWDRITKSSTNSNTALSILRSGSKNGNERRFENREARRNELERLHEAYDSKKKNVTSKPANRKPKKDIRKKRPRVESKQEYAQSLQEQMRQRREMEKNRLAEERRLVEEEAESLYDLRPSTYKSNIIMEEKQNYGDFLKAQIEEKRQRENRERFMSRETTM